MKTLNKSFWKSLMPDIVAIAIFILIAVIYCSPMLDGKVLQAGDSMSWKGMYREAEVYHQQAGNFTLQALNAHAETTQIRFGFRPETINKEKKCHFCSYLLWMTPSLD